MRIEFHPRKAILFLIVVLVVISSVSVVSALITDSPDDAEPQQLTIELEDGSQLWPYTSRAPDFSERTLSINVVIYGDAHLTETILRQEAIGDWQDVEEDEQDIAPAEEFDLRLNETTIAWGTAAGAERFVYVETPDGEGQWLAESYQLRDGDYLGDRYHIRAYADPSAGEWTAMQAHLEHWDWFHLRHTVHSIEDAQLYVEAEFIDRWFVESLHRDRFGNDGSSDSDGWATIVTLIDGVPMMVGIGLIAAIGHRWRQQYDTIEEFTTTESVREFSRGLLVVGSIVLFYFGIRYGAIAVERFVDGLNPKVVVALFYPLLVLGMPILAYLTSRKLNAFHAFAAASVGFAIAIMIDYTVLGVTNLPLDTFVHRIVLAIAIGFIAAGASQTARKPGIEPGHVRTGALLWAVAVVLPLLQFL